MHSKTIIVSCGDAVTPERAAALFSSMDADVRALKVPPNQALDAMRGASFDMLLIDDSDGSCDLAEVEAALSRGGSTTALFVVMAVPLQCASPSRFPLISHASTPPMTR